MTSTELVPYTDAQYTVVESAETDATLIDAWLHGVPAQTQRAYRREIRDMQFFLGDKQLQDITLYDLQEYDKVVLMGKAETSRKRAIAAIKSLYKRLRQSGLLVVNPAEFLRVPKIKETQAERYLTAEQVNAIIAQAKTERDRVMLVLFYQTGMRVSEVVSLTWKDILPTATGATLVVLGKGMKTRYVAIDQEMYSELVALPHTAACVFPSGWIQSEGDKPTGKPITTTQAQRIVVAAAERTGIDASPHYFRHAHISHLFEAGVNAVEIRDEVGHANLTTTNRYAHSVGGKALGSVLRRK